MRPLLTAFMGAIGMNSTKIAHTTHFSEAKGGSNLQRSSKKKLATDLSEFSVLDEGHDSWSTPTKTGSNDELPLHSIQVHKDFEQKVETDSRSDGWLDDGRRRSWYPGN